MSTDAGEQPPAGPAVGGPYPPPQPPPGWQQPPPGWQQSPPGWQQPPPGWQQPPPGWQQPPPGWQQPPPGWQPESPAGWQPAGSYPYPQAPGQPYPPASGPGERHGARPRTTNTMAVLALVFAFLVAPLGVVFGAIGLKQTRERGQGGRGLALAGIVVGSLATVLAVALAVVLSVTADVATRAEATTNFCAVFTPDLARPMLHDQPLTQTGATGAGCRYQTADGAGSVVAGPSDQDCDQLKNQYGSDGNRWSDSTTLGPGTRECDYDLDRGGSVETDFVWQHDGGAWYRVQLIDPGAQNGNEDACYLAAGKIDAHL